MAETETIEATVPRNATLDSLLRENHLQEGLVSRVVTAAHDVFDLRQLRAERPYRLVRSLDGLLREFEYQIDADRFLRIVNLDRAHPEAIEAKVVPYEKTTTIAAIDATIDAGAPSLIAAIDDEGENIQLALELADIFSGEVDFRTELQPGDRLRVLFEKSSARRRVLGLRRDPRRRARPVGTASPGVPLDRRRQRQGGLLRRKRPLAEALFPEVAAEVRSRAAHHLRLLAASPPPDRSRRQGASRG